MSDSGEARLEAVVDIARELYDRFVMGGWEPQDVHPWLEERLKEFAAAVRDQRQWISVEKYGLPTADELNPARSIRVEIWHEGTAKNDIGFFWFASRMPGYWQGQYYEDLDKVRFWKHLTAAPRKAMLPAPPKEGQ